MTALPCLPSCFASPCWPVIRPGSSVPVSGSDFVRSQLVYGPLVGAAVGWLGGLLVDRAARRGWMNDTFQRLASAALAMLAYAAAEEVHGNGFIAAYFAGLLLGVRSHAVQGTAAGIRRGRRTATGALHLPAFRPGPGAGSPAPLGQPGLDLCGPQPHGHPDAAGGPEPDRRRPRPAFRRLHRLVRSPGHRLHPLLDLSGGKTGSQKLEYVLSVVVLTVLLSVFAHGMTAVPLAGAYGRYLSGKTKQANPG